MESVRRKLTKAAAVAAMVAMLCSAGVAGSSKGGSKGGNSKGGHSSKSYYEKVCFEVKLRHIDRYGCLGCYTDCWYKAEGKLNCKTYAFTFCSKGYVENKSCKDVCFRCLDASEFCGIPTDYGCIKCDYKVDKRGCALLTGSN